MAKNEVKSKNHTGLILGIVLAVIAVGVALFFLLSPKSEAKSIMECNIEGASALSIAPQSNGLSVNKAPAGETPNMQFVLDQNNMVMEINCMNKEAQILTAKANFQGKSADEAAKMYVEVSTQLGYINVDTTGTKVAVTIYANEDFDASKLNAEIEKKVNGYFDQMGIIAGAVAEKSTALVDELKTELQKMGAYTKEVAVMTEKDLIALYNERASELKEVAFEKRAQYNQAFREGKGALKEDARELLESAKNHFAQVEEQVKSAKETLKQAEADWKAETNEDAKKAKKAIVETSKTALTTVEKTLNEVKSHMKAMQEQFDKRAKEFAEEFKTKLANLEKDSKEAFNQAKTTFDNLKKDAQTLINAHVKASENAIKAYRDTLKASK